MWFRASGHVGKSCKLVILFPEIESTIASAEVNGSRSYDSRYTQQGLLTRVQMGSWLDYSRFKLRE